MDFGGISHADFRTPHCWTMNTQASLPSCNRVCHHGQCTAQEIQDIVQYFNGTPFTWFIDSHDSVTRNLLLHHGLQYKGIFPTMTLMVQELEAAEYNQGIVIEEIHDTQQLSHWISLVTESFDLKAGEFATVIEYCLRHAPANTLRFYSGLFQGKRVATCLAVYHQDVVSLHWISTHKEYRGKGMGFAITHKALRDAQEQGVQQAVLIASALGIPTYDKIGFKIYGWYQVYGNY